MKPQRIEKGYLYGVATAVCLVIAGAALYAVLEMREGVQTRISDSSLNLAVSVRQTVEGMVDSIDLALLAAADEVVRQNATGQPDSKAIDFYLDQQARRLPHVAFIRGTDAKGDVVYGPGRPGTVVSMADRDFFLSLRNSPSALSLIHI